MYIHFYMFFSFFLFQLIFLLTNNDSKIYKNVQFSIENQLINKSLNIDLIV